MSERTTIGGVVYESIGSSSSNLLLKCNGTARIQWGNKLIDLIKNGKIVSGDTSTQIFIVSNKEEIKQDGIYLINNEKSQELWICKKGEQYNLINADLYISANTKQDITAEQQKQALHNIGFYYETIEDVENAKIQNGLVYVLEDKTLYSINNGVIEEFEAKLKTVTVEKENETGEVINSQYKIVLSVSGEEYIKLENRNIAVSQNLSMSENAQICSEGATSNIGYRLYIKDYESWLEVDNLIVRNNNTQDDYFTEITFSELNEYISQNKLIPGHWYIITDFQNHWKLPKNDVRFNRPILIQAETNNTIYQNGYLYEDRNIKIKYDITFQNIINDIYENRKITTRGKIIWMQDEFNNEANFDFLDYTDYNNQPLTKLHTNSRGYNSIFPVNSSNNKVELYNLVGTIIKESEDGKYYVDTAEKIQDTTEEIQDTTEKIQNTVIFNCTGMHDNILSGTNIFIQNSCKYFDKNIIKDINNLTISGNIRNCTFETITNCTFNGNINQSTFKDLTNCIFESGDIINLDCLSNLDGFIFSSENYSILYNQLKYKEMYMQNNVLHIICPLEHLFHRGMIMMHSGIEAIPEGWAICDGKEYEYNGFKTTTPNLINKFIKAVSSVNDVKEVNNPNLNSDNEFTLQEKHLPPHSHPHISHTHTFSGVSATIHNSESLSTTLENEYISNISTTSTQVITDVSGENITTTSENVINSISIETAGGNTSGGIHAHEITITNGTISKTTSIEQTNSVKTDTEDTNSEENNTEQTNTESTSTEETSTEQTKTWTNEAFKIEPNYYSLIFIMKL